MKSFGRNVLTVLGWSVATCGLVLAVSLPATVNATNRATLGRVVDPVFEQDGVRITVTILDAKSSQVTAVPGTGLHATIVATNTTNESVTLKPTLAVHSTPIPSAMSRTMPMPQQVWQEELTVALAPGETRTILLPQIVTMPDKAHLAFSMTGGSSSATLVRVSP